MGLLFLFAFTQVLSLSNPPSFQTEFPWLTLGAPFKPALGLEWDTTALDGF
jgi:hypothetical protein